MKNKLFKTIESLEPDMIALLSELISIPAIDPSDGGKGEYQKGQLIINKLKELGFNKVEVYNSEDSSAECGVRPNIVIRTEGRTKKRLWIISHIDVVPEGNSSLWNTDPFKAVLKDGKLYGRGTSDNGQELVSSLYALIALQKNNILPKYEICLCMVANEESGSKYGIYHLIKQNLFDKEDLIVVPDGGSSDGAFIQVAEKSICWIEFEVTGKQAHASMPDLGNNACRAANKFSVALDEALHTAFPEADNLFVPTFSTFEPTFRAANVPNINTIPGHERFCFDCRVLPSVPLEAVIKVVNAEIKNIENKLKVNITYKFIQKEQAPAPTSSTAPVVELLKNALVQVISATPKIGGIGGGTCAAFFRKEGIPAVVWNQEDPVAHMPNEYAKVEHILNEAKVFALMMAGM